MSVALRRVARIDFTASDLDRMARFYGALGFVETGRQPVAAAELALLGLPGVRAARLAMRLGTQDVTFVAFDPPGRPYPDGSASTDLWFQHIAIAVSDMGEAYRRAMAAGARPISRDGPETLPPNTGGVTAFKFRDPDGRPLELLSFPQGVGAADWQAPGETSPFLGIDHTAVAVGDAVRSQAFYEGLGLVAGKASHNHGVEQERLDDVTGDHCRVVPMMPPEAPPHVELLAYEVGLRRPMPADTRPDDLWATRTWLEGRPPDDQGSDRAGAVLMDDPDGHILVVATGAAFS